MDLPLFDARMLRPLVDFLERHGVKAERYLDAQRIPRETVSAGGWITKKQAYDLVSAVVEGEHCPEAIFAAYADFQLDDLGPIVAAMSTCRTVKEAFDVTLRLGSMAYEGNEYFLEIDGHTTWMSYREPRRISPGQELINDMTLAVYRRIICLTVDPTWRPQGLRTQGPAFHRHRAVDAFEDCSLTSHARSTGIAFPTEFLRRPFNLPLTKLNVARCGAWALDCDGECGLVRSVYRLVSARFHYSKPPTLQEVATLSGASTATLKRHLAMAGITYQALLDRVRFDAAHEMLSNTELTVKEIAHDLGYSGTNNFVRAFRRMTAMTPADYRCRAQNDCRSAR